MLILQFIYFSFAVKCPDGTPYIYDKNFDIKISKNEWYYFRTNIRKKPLFGIAVKSDYPISLYSSDAYECPDESFPSFLNVTVPSHFFRGNEYYHSSNGIISIGIKAFENSHIYVRLEGQYIMKKSSKFIIKLSITFLIMISVTGFYFFYIVLPNEMKEKDKKENDFFSNQF